MTPTLPRKILVLRNNLLINAGVQSLLSGQDDLEVIGQEIHDQKELLGYISHVIIMDEWVLVPNLTMLLMFLQHYPKKRTILVSLKENQVQIYDTKQIHVQELRDFLAVVWGASVV
jgi:hypothetical protein